MRTSTKQPRGIALIYIMVATVVLVGFISFAVDYGRIQLAKTELQAAADTAARAGAAKLAKGGTDAQVQAEAALWASRNNVDGNQPVVLLNTAAPPDVQAGNWDPTLTPRFSTARTPKNAVQVTAYRNTARHNAIPLLLGGLLGHRTSDIHAVCVASLKISGYGMVGLDYIKMSGNSSTSYWSTSPGTTGQYGSIASNGSISLSGSSSIQGDARPGMGKQVYGSGVTGSTAPLTTPLSYPNGDGSAYAISNDNNLISSTYLNSSQGQNLFVKNNGVCTAPGGTYYFHDVTIAAGGSLVFTGPTTLYVWGNFNMSGNTSTSSSLPKNLTIIMCPNGSTPPGSMTISSNAALYADIYAPQSNITLSGTGDIYGAVVGKSITMSGTSNIHYDLSLSGSNGAVSLVE